MRLQLSWSCKVQRIFETRTFRLVQILNIGHDRLNLDTLMIQLIVLQEAQICMTIILLLQKESAVCTHFKVYHTINRFCEEFVH
jgi:hypothetical protein